MNGKIEGGRPMVDYPINLHAMEICECYFLHKKKIRPINSNSIRLPNERRSLQYLK